MFTGIIEEMGEVRLLQRKPVEGGLTVALPKQWKIRLGDSISVNGVCLTARDVKQGEVTFDCMAETFRRTALSYLTAGDAVNLERPLTLQTPLGGHFVQGHVDGTGIVKSIKSEGQSRLLRIGSLEKFPHFFLEKGSVAVDGVSLTVVETFKDGFSVSLIPFTLKTTTLGRKRVGERVNIEADMIVKTVAGLLQRFKH